MSAVPDRDPDGDAPPREGEYLAAGAGARRAGPRGVLRGLRFPKLFVLVAGLFVVDLLVPDVIPFVDEIVLGGLALMLGMLKRRVRGEPEPRDDVE